MITPKYPLLWPAGQKRTAFPRKSKFGKKSQSVSGFQSLRPLTINQASLELQAEVQRLTGSSDFILSCNVEFRDDGIPYSKQRATDDKGVAIYFKYIKRDTTIACDSFDSIADNIYAIAKTIEAMRSIERNGSSQLMEQAFTGFQALPEKAGGVSWYDFMGLDRDASLEEINSRYRELAKKFHPDVAGGSDEQFNFLVQMFRQATAVKKV